MSSLTNQDAINSIDIDVGGTFTDFVLTLDGERHIAKCPTTPHDLSVGFLNAVEAGGDKVGLSVEELLPRIDIIRYSTTVALNRLLQRQGPRIGLLTTEGHEDAIIIGRGAQWTDGQRVAERRNIAVQNKPHPLIERDLILGVRERIDSTGSVVRPLDEEDVRTKLRMLMDRGARAIVVSLLWSFMNPAHEKRVREIIREEYKEYHIGFVPVVLSSSVVAKIGEYERTMTAVLDAYLQRSMQNDIGATWDKLRAKGYHGAFLMIHNSGGSADIFKTPASRTFNGGPVAGLMGSAYFANKLGYKNVVAGDVGGTSFDVALVVESSVRNYTFRPVIDKWMVNVTMMQTISVGSGGGSIAKVDRTGARLEVGPRSAGSMPGPVCYDLGGTEPTVTDADVGARLHQPGHLLRRPDATQQGEGREGDPREDRAAAGDRNDRGGCTDPPHRRREHGLGDQTRSAYARLSPRGLRAVRLRRRRSDSHGWSQGRHPESGGLPGRTGVLRDGLVDHGHRAYVRAVAPHGVHGAADRTLRRRLRAL